MATAAEKKKEQEQKEQEAREKEGQEGNGQPTEEALMGLTEGEHNPYAHGLLLQAKRLREEKEHLFKLIATNREQLRGMRDLGFVSDEQRAAIEEWYPTPKKKDKDTDATTNSAGDTAPAAA